MPRSTRLLNRLQPKSLQKKSERCLKISKKYKRGTLDNIFIVVEIFVLALVILLAGTFWNKISSSDLDDIWEHNSVSQNAKDKGQRAYDQMDNIFLIAYFAMHIGILILAFFLRSHPIALLLIFLVAIILAILTAPLSNVYAEIIAEPDLSEFSATMPKTNFIITQLPFFEIAWTILTGVILVGLARLD